MKHLSAFLLFLVALARVCAQQLDAPITLPVEFLVQGKVSTSAVGTVTISAPSETGANPAKVILSSPANSVIGSLPVSGRNVASLKPGKDYTFTVTMSGGLSEWRLLLNTPTGVSVYMDDIERQRLDGTQTSRTIKVRLDDGASLPVGQTTDLRPGRVIWSVGLGAIKSGRPAGVVSLRSNDLSALSFTPAALIYDFESPDVEKIVVNGSIRQISAPECLVDVITNSASSFTLKFIKPSLVAASKVNGLWTWSGTPSITYTIENSNPNPQVFDRLKISQVNTIGGSTRTSWTEIQKFGTHWHVSPWNTRPGPGIPITRTWWRYPVPDPGANPTEIIEIQSDSDPGVISAKTVQEYKDYAWGRELLVRKVGNPDGLGQDLPRYSTYIYHSVLNPSGTDNFGAYRKVQWKCDESGKWERYDYCEQADSDLFTEGQIKRSYRPYGDLPASPADATTANCAVTEYTYTDDHYSGRKNMPATIETKVSGTTVEKAAITYSDETINGLPVLVATRKDYASSSSTDYLTSVTRTFRADADPARHFWPGLSHSVRRPDQTMQAHVYVRGTFSYATRGWTAAADGLDLLHLVIEGTTNPAGAVQHRTWDAGGQTWFIADDFYVVPGKSALTGEIRSAQGTVLRTDRRIYTSSGWQLVQREVIEYVDGLSAYPCRKTVDYGDATKTFTTFEAGYAGGVLSWVRNAEGVEQQFVYDEVGRVTITRRLGVAGRTDGTEKDLWKTVTYDPAGRVLTERLADARRDPLPGDIVTSSTYDWAGRQRTSTVPAVMGTFVTTATTTYEVDNDSFCKFRIFKALYPDGSTKIVESYRDGRPKSVSGTSVVPITYLYAIEAGTGRSIATKQMGNAARWSSVTTDWLGRTVKTEQPANNGTTATSVASIAAYNTYGQLDYTQTASLARTYSYYNTLGVANSSVVDVDGVPATLGAADRKATSDYGWRQDANVWSRYTGDTDTWWSYAESSVYPDGATTGQILSKSWTRLTNFDRVSGPSGVAGSAIAETVTADANGNRSVSQTFLDRATCKVTQVAYSPFAVQPAITVSVGGSAVSATDAAGVTVQNRYDVFRRAIRTIDRTTGTATNNNITYYTGTNQVQFVTDNLNVQQHAFRYDNMGRLTGDKTPKVLADGTVSGTVSSRTAYNLRGQVTHQWGDVPNPVKFVYSDTYGELSAQYTYHGATSAAIAWATVDLPTNGWPADSAGDKTSFAYYVSTGLIQTKTDAALVANDTGKTTQYSYNARNQLKTLTLPRGTSVNYSYFETAGEATGELKKVEHFVGGAPDTSIDVAFTYDRLGRTKTVQDATGWRTFTFRSVDQQADSELFGRNGATTTASLYGTTRQLTSRYEATTGRFIGLSLLNGTAAEHSLTYGFDPASSRLATISSGAGVFRYGYVANSSLVAGFTRGGFSQSRAYETNRNLLASIGTTSQAGTIAGFGFTNDALGRRTTATHDGLIYAAHRGAANQDMVTTYGYDDRDEVTSAITTVNGTALPGRNFGYTFDPIGNRTAEKLDGTSYAYAPNALNQYDSRATPATVPVSGSANHAGGANVKVGTTTLAASAWRNDFFYAAVNKATPGSAAYQAIILEVSNSSTTTPAQSSVAGTIARPTSENFEYDSNGNLTSDSLWTYSYDSEDRLSSMAAKAFGGEGFKAVVAFTYDYLGRRAAKTVSKVSSGGVVTLVSKTVFAWQGYTLLAEYDALAGTAQTLTRRFTFGLDLAGGLGGAGDVGGLLAIEDLRPAFAGGNGGAPATFLPAYDGNGNVVALTDGATGALAATYEYDPFGNLLQASGAYGAENPFRFASKYYDRETGLYQYNHRYYSPSLGRFINRDPIAEAGGLNLYAYCGNRSVNTWDVLGKAGEDLVILNPFVVSGWTPFTTYTTWGAWDSFWNDLNGNLWAIPNLTIPWNQVVPPPNKTSQTPPKTNPVVHPTDKNPAPTNTTPVTNPTDTTQSVARTGDGNSWNRSGLGTYLPGNDMYERMFPRGSIAYPDDGMEHGYDPYSRGGLLASLWEGIKLGLVSGGTREDIELRQAQMTSRFLGNVAYGATIGTAISAKNHWDAGNAAYLGGDNTMMFLHSLAAMGDVASLGLLADGAYNGLRSGFASAAENGALRFTQTTASPWFSAEGKFAGQTISDVAGKLRAGTLTAADVPVTLVGDGLIANTRSSLALMQAGIPQAEWTLLRGSAQMEAEIAARMARNGLGSTGTDVLRITGSGGNASTLIGSGTIPPRF